MSASRGGVFGSAHSVSDRYRRRLLAAAGLSNSLLFSNLNTTITIKSSPPKTARQTAAYLYLSSQRRPTTTLQGPNFQVESGAVMLLYDATHPVAAGAPLARGRDWPPELGPLCTE